MHKKYLAIACAILILLTGCGSNTNESENVTADNESEETTTENTSGGENEIQNGDSNISDYFLVTNVYGDGQKPWYVVLEYDTEIAATSVEVEDFDMEDYDIEAVYVSTDNEIPEMSTDGKYILIELSTDYTTSNYGGSGVGSSTDSNFNPDELEESDDSIISMNSLDSDDSQTEVPSEEIPDDTSDDGSFDRSEGRFFDGDSMDGNEGRSFNGDSIDGDDNRASGGGRGGQAGSISSVASNEITVSFTFVGEISTVDGLTISGNGENYTTDIAKNINLLVDNFTQDTFTTEDGTELMYSIYLPDDYTDDSEYPLVLFMPDATGEGDDVYLALTESLGGVIWTEEEWQEKYPTIVLVPQYTSDNTENDAYTMELVNDISSQYSVDTNRLYLVGQSSGTIRSLKLMIDYPDTFAAGMLVAGQADSEYEDLLANLSDQHIWFIASEGDARAYPGIQAIVDAVESEGTEVTVNQWSAKLSDEEQEELAQTMEEAGTSINWTVFDANTVMEDDVTSSDATEHMNTWRVAYNLDTIREWMFAQSK